MRLNCHVCGARDRREFYYQGAEEMRARPAEEASSEVWHDWLHLRDNPAGVTRELWYHAGGCGAWIVVTRNTVTHDMLGSELLEARDAG